MATLSIHLDNNHIILEHQITDNNRSNLLTGSITIQNWNYSTPIASTCALKQPEIRLIGEASILDDITTTFLDTRAHLLSFNTDNNYIVTPNTTGNKLLCNRDRVNGTTTTSALSSVPFSTLTTIGTHNKSSINFPFSIPLDKTLPGSFSCADRFIRYTVHVSIVSAISSTQHMRRHVENAININSNNTNDSKNDIIKIQATQPVFIHHHNNSNYNSNSPIGYNFSWTTTIATTTTIPNKLYWGTSKRSQLWRYEIQFPRVVTLNDVFSSTDTDNEQPSFEENNEKNTTNNNNNNNSNFYCVLNTILRMKNIQQHRKPHHRYHYHLSRQKEQQQSETITDMTKQSKSCTEYCIAEFKFIEKSSVNIPPTEAITLKNKNNYTSSCSYCHDTKALPKATSITTLATTTKTTTLLHSETHSLSSPSDSWDDPWNVSLKLDKVPLPTTGTTRKKSHNMNTASCNCGNEILRIQHYLEINLTFDDGNGYIDYNTHTFPISVIPSLSVLNKEEEATTTTITKCPPSSFFSSKKKHTLHRDTSFDSTTSLNTSISSNVNSDDDSSSSSYTAASSLVYYSSSDEGYSKNKVNLN